MVTKIRIWAQRISSSFWFIPGVIVLASVALATVLIAIDATVELEFVVKWHLVFGSSASGARDLLTIVAGSMITVAGVVFSVTLVALSLTSTQYTPRVIRSFMQDRGTQAVLGIFVGIFTYCLVVLRTISDVDERTFVPQLAVLGGLFLAFVGVAFLIYFIHHISTSIQASNIIAAAAREALVTVNRLYPEELGEVGEKDMSDNLQASLMNQHWSVVTVRKTGYIGNIDVNELLDFARKHETVLRMESGIGKFVIEGTPLISLMGQHDLNDEIRAELNAAYVIGRERMVENDAGFGIRQLVDIAMKALSPGINDTSTAVICVDYLSAILVRLATRRIAFSHLMDQGKLLIITKGPTFESLLTEAFEQIRQNAAGNVAVMSRILGAYQAIASRTVSQSRRRTVRAKVELIADLAERTIESPHDLAKFKSRLARVRKALQDDF